MVPTILIAGGELENHVAPCVPRDESNHKDVGSYFSIKTVPISNYGPNTLVH
jgi:hypothetical protein